MHPPPIAVDGHRKVVELHAAVGIKPFLIIEHDAEIAGVDPQGPLMLRLPSGEERSYWFKEVKFVLPCGVTKE